MDQRENARREREELRIDSLSGPQKHEAEKQEVERQRRYNEERARHTNSGDNVEN